jgi:hypothetical protein
MKRADGGFAKNLAEVLSLIGEGEMQMKLKSKRVWIGGTFLPATLEIENGKIVTAAVADAADLEKLLDEMAAFGSTATHLILSTPVAGKKIDLS